MSDFKTAYPDSVSLDPYKRVNFTTGMVMGVDEFLQGESYLLEKHYLHNRTLHGYGTLCGLHVSQENTANGVQIRVKPGVAVNPQGREIRVPQDQCGLLNGWLERNNEEVQTALGSPPERLEVFLILCYDECRTDEIPIPSGPCISLEDSKVASRIADAFDLRFVFEEDRPDQIEEEKVRELIDLLHQIEISDGPGEFLTREQLEDLVRGLIETTSPPAVSPPITSPSMPMRMRSTDVKEFINAAFRVWVTEVRPQLLEAGRNCVNGPPLEKCVMLARLEFDVEEVDSILRVSGDVTIDQDNRPYLLHSRLLQDFITGLSIHPAMLAGAYNQFEKRYSLPPLLSRRVMGAASSSTIQGVPRIRYQRGGDAAFTLSVPDDMDFSEPVRVRLIYSFNVGGGATGNVGLSWRILNRSYSLDEVLPADTSDYASVDFTCTIPRAQRNTLLATDFIDLPDPFSPTDLNGTLRVRLTSTTPATPTVTVNVLEVEVAYTANRLGRQLP